ncbi:MAG: ATP phosphoribosyltransferase regulatory subunit [Reyranellaceae bacterium]
MNDNEHKGLLPAGLGDMLPPEAALEASVIEQLMARLAANGYDRVKPPLIEFEESLLAGAGQQMASQTFRLMDPISQRMLGVRADMTLQIARIAASRLRDVGRPLRLSYAGQVLRVKGSQLRPERQFAQIGAELIGSDSVEADVEAVLLSALALRSLGIETLSVDLNLPTLLAAVGSGTGVPDGKFPRLHDALERKDEAGVRALLGQDHPEAMALFVALLRMVGPAEAVVAKIAGLDLPPAARIEAMRLADAVKRLRAADAKLKLTVDPVEYRGFEYHTGVSFTLFALGVRGELGRGGRYVTRDGEAATGFTLYMDTILQAVKPPAAKRRLLLPAGTPIAERQRLQKEGFVTVTALDGGADLRIEARRVGCGHALIDGAVVALSQ